MEANYKPPVSASPTDLKALGGRVTGSGVDLVHILMWPPPEEPTTGVNRLAVHFPTLREPVRGPEATA
jgi:hypothetical protein